MKKHIEIKKFIISDDDGVVRIDKYLAIKLPEYSRSALQKVFKLGHVYLGDRLLKPGEKVRPGAEIRVNLEGIDLIPDDIDMPIIYEDDNIIVVDKPSGVISHARGRFWQESSVASFIRHRVKNIDGERAGIVHRLDRATSGVMVCAKNKDAMKHLQQQFHDRTVQKTYVAAVSLKPKDDSAIIDAPIGRDLKNPKKFHVTPNGKSAVTKYRVMDKLKNAYLVELEPQTGRTHQLRIHLSYLGRPIIGDELYGGVVADRLYLHAKSLSITTPDGKQMTFESPTPKEFYEL